MYWYIMFYKISSIYFYEQCDWSIKTYKLCIFGRNLSCLLNAAVHTFYIAFILILIYKCSLAAVSNFFYKSFNSN